MKKLLITAFGVLFASTAAHAADIVNYQPESVAPMAAPVMAPAFTWTGFYAGGELGGSWANAKTRAKQNGAAIGKMKVKPDGFIGGIMAGYNFQFNDTIILGADTDFLWGNIKNSKKRDDGNFRVKQKWNGATRIRAGYAFDRFLPYVAAGVSYADISGLYLKKKNGGYEGGKNKGSTRAGWNLGAGVDYIPPIMNDHLVLRAEYRYTDFGKKTYNLGDNIKYRVKYNQSDFRVGVAYKF